ncbi:hypothetical protein FRC03_012071 [Tulasnella sp. 419]|nr:hypothetical protein FRC02_010613 [Tulasnella sp. 418]KAG8952568.1 hypothetical protein FRC03_012071 [Tulasnella sp. 419]
MAPAVPLYVARLVSLFLAFALAIVGLASAAHAKIRSDDVKAAAQRTVSKTGLNANLVIDTSDITRAGTAAAVAQALILLSALTSLLLLLFASKTSSARAPLSTRTLPAQAGALLFSVIFAFATAVVCTVFVANRGAVITATIGGRAVPQSLIDSLKRQFGFETEYRVRDYLIFLAVAPWIGFLFGSIAAGITLIALSKRHEIERVETRSSELEKQPDVRVE